MKFQQQGFRDLHPQQQVPTPIEVQRLMTKVSQQQGDFPVCHGETGTTYGGVGYSPLFRSIRIPTRTLCSIRAGLTKEEAGII